MANDLYRGYEIKFHVNGGFYWTDELGVDHVNNDGAGYPTSDKAMDAVDAYRRHLRSQVSA